MSRLNQLVVMALALSACATTPPALPASAEIAYRGLQRAVHDRQRDSLWSLLDQRTREAWQIAWRARRASHELLALLERDDITNDPELRGLPALPPARSQDLFTASLSEPDLAALAEDLNPTAPLIELGTDAQVLTASGERIPFRKASDGTWGFAGLAEPARQAAQRELVLLERLARLVSLHTPGLLPGSMPWR